MIEPTSVTFPPSLIFPVEIVKILKIAGSSIKRHDPLVTYRYIVEESVESEEESAHKVKRERYGTFESPIEGEVSQWQVSIGDTINDSKSPLVSVIEPCTHPVQFGGLCAVCGQTLDNKDYTEYDNKERAPINMAHDTTKLTVSYAEAARIEKSREDQLKSKRKLVLVVDLDQTVIQAAVDSEIGNWMRDPSNPNYESLEDVKSFELEEWKPSNTPLARACKTVCRYYVKLRPGLEMFLAKMSEFYEMHVYTMATKSYAMAIAKLIDPDGVYFSDRILARDFSGSLTRKKLERLFPASTSMVTIIDDRGDVWDWSSNLIKVVPYSFFADIGDINSNLLPVKEGELRATMSKDMEKNDKSSNDEKEIGENDSAGQISGQKENNDDSKDSKVIKEIKQMTVEPIKSENQHEKNPVKLENSKNQKVLIDDDKELSNVQKALSAIHEKYYQEYDEGKEPDLKIIIPKMKSKIFQECVILFSGVIPLRTKLDSADIVQWVRSFGARVVPDLTDEVTHLVATSKRTSKVRQAVAKKDQNNIHIVYTDWVMVCLAEWRRVSEKNYEMEFSEEEMKFIRREMTDEKRRNEENENKGKFMESLKQSDMNWDDMDKELEEFMGTDDDSSEGEEEEEEEEKDHDEEQIENPLNGRKRSSDEEMEEIIENKRSKFGDVDQNNDDGDEDDTSSIDEDFLRELENDLL